MSCVSCHYGSYALTQKPLKEAFKCKKALKPSKILTKGLRFTGKRGFQEGTTYRNKADVAYYRLNWPRGRYSDNENCNKL